MWVCGSVGETAQNVTPAETYVDIQEHGPSIAIAGEEEGNKGASKQVE